MISKIGKINDQIIHLVFKNTETMARVLCRIQEHYESPEYAGKVFTLGQFRKWYSEKTGGWTYHLDWSGFNFPSSALTAFFDGSFDPLSAEEQEVINLLKDRKGPFYVIATDDTSDSETLTDEIMHGLFHTNPDYQKEVLGLLEGQDLGPLKTYLRTMYHEKVIIDECHAWIATDTWHLDTKKIAHPRELKSKLLAIKDKYLK